MKKFFKTILSDRQLTIGCLLLVMLVIDLLYAALDPRIRYE